MQRYTAEELEAMPTLSESQTDDLKVDTGQIRVWLCRCGVDDGMPYNDQVTVEMLNPKNYRWETVDEYPG